MCHCTTELFPRGATKRAFGKSMEAQQPQGHTHRAAPASGPTPRWTPSAGLGTGGDRRGQAEGPAGGLTHPTAARLTQGQTQLRLGELRGNIPAVSASTENPSGPSLVQKSVLGEPKCALLSEGTAPRAGSLLCQPAHTHALASPCTGNSAPTPKSPHKAQAGTKAQPVVFVRVCCDGYGVQGELPAL